MSDNAVAFGMIVLFCVMFVLYAGEPDILDGLIKMANSGVCR